MLLKQDPPTHRGMHVQHSNKPSPSNTATTELEKFRSGAHYGETRNLERLPLTGNVDRNALSSLDEFNDDADSLVCLTHDDSGIIFVKVHRSG